MTFMTDLVRQGHPTFDLTFPISGPNKLEYFLFLRFLDPGTRKKLNKYGHLYA